MDFPVRSSPLAQGRTQRPVVDSFAPRSTGFLHVQHYLAPLLKPQSVALVGASEQSGSLGRTVYENLLAGQFKGSIYAVNPNHRRIFGREAFPTVAAIGKPIDLAVIAAPASAIPGILDDPRGRMRTAAIISFPETDPTLNKPWLKQVANIAKARGIRVLGPGAFGVVRTDIGLNATFCAPMALGGRLALVAQSGAVCTAMLDFAGPIQMGFSTVTSLGGAIDISFGELLDALVNDPQTDGILLYVESVGNARSMMSALRQAARTKPVVVLKAGRSREHAPEIDALGEPALAPDTVFDAAHDARRHRARAHLHPALRRGAHPGTRQDPARRSSRDRVQRPRARHPRGRFGRRGGRGARGARARYREGAGRASAAGDRARESGGRARRCATRAPGGRGRHHAVGPERGCRARAARAAPDHRCDRSGARGGRRRARFAQAGAGRVARRAASPRGASRAGGGRHREFLHAGERGRRVCVPRRVPPQPGMAAGGAVVAARSRAARSRVGRAAARARARGEARPAAARRDPAVARRLRHRDRAARGGHLARRRTGRGAPPALSGHDHARRRVAAGRARRPRQRPRARARVARARRRAAGEDRGPAGGRPALDAARAWRAPVRSRSPRTPCSAP